MLRKNFGLESERRAILERALALKEGHARSMNQSAVATTANAKWRPYLSAVNMNNSPFLASSLILKATILAMLSLNIGWFAALSLR